jgi:putative transposase
VQDWAKERDINWHCIEPGKPRQNSYIESGSGRLCDEFRNKNYWKDLAEVRKETSEYRQDGSEERPHSALCYLPPVEYARRLLTGESLGGNASRLTRKRADPVSVAPARSDLQDVRTDASLTGMRSGL